MDIIIIITIIIIIIALVVVVADPIAHNVQVEVYDKEGDYAQHERGIGMGPLLLMKPLHLFSFLFLVRFVMRVSAHSFMRDKREERVKPPHITCV